jgi:hypothetical protein
MARPRKPIRKTTRQKKIAGWRRLLPQIRFGALVLIVAVFSLASAAAQVWAYHNTQLPQVLRDAVIVLVAHARAGDEIPITDVDYSGGEQQNTDQTWDLKTNSLWLVRQTTLIVPLLVYEGVGAGRYPAEVFFAPFQGNRSFHVAGTTNCEQATPVSPITCWVMLNERFVLDPGWNDMRGLLATLVHEEIHDQGGRFMDDPDVTDWDTKSAHLESKTSAATIEVLAAWCNKRNELACKAFWAEIESMARVTLRYRLQEAPWLYDLFSNIFLRDGAEEREARKNNRFWATHQDELYDIMLKYSVDPWENHVLAAMKFGRPLNTGVPVWESDNTYKYLNLYFDDTYDLLGPLAWLMNLLTP